MQQTAPKPAIAPHRERYLHIAKRNGEPYLADNDGRYYHIGRDSNGDIYPAYYDEVTDRDYPLYYDSSRDRYYRVCREEGRYYMNFVDDSSGRYYECDQDFDYDAYDPPSYDCPVIDDGNTSFTCYDEPAYYHDRNRYYHHWIHDDWLAAVPIVIGFYFVLNDDDHPAPSWYYGYNGNQRWAYREDPRRAQVNFYEGGQRMTRTFSVSPPPTAMAPRQQWAHLAAVYSDHRSPARAWGHPGENRAVVAANAGYRNGAAYANRSNVAVAAYNAGTLHGPGHPSGALGGRRQLSAKPFANGHSHAVTAAVLAGTGAALHAQHVAVQHRQLANARVATRHKQIAMAMHKTGAWQARTYGHAPIAAHRNAIATSARPLRTAYAHVARASHANKVYRQSPQHQSVARAFSPRRTAPRYNVRVAREQRFNSPSRRSAPGGFHPREYHSSMPSFRSNARQRSFGGGGFHGGGAPRSFSGGGNHGGGPPRQAGDGNRGGGEDRRR